MAAKAAAKVANMAKEISRPGDKQVGRVADNGPPSRTGRAASKPLHSRAQVVAASHSKVPSNGQLRMMITWSPARSTMPLTSAVATVDGHISVL